MSEEQLSALLAKLKEDTDLQARLKGAADIDAAVAIAKEAGFDVSKEDWLKYQSQQPLELSDEDLENLAGGTGATWDCASQIQACVTHLARDGCTGGKVLC